MSVNKVILVGRLGQNPELRYTPSGMAVANFSLATNDNWTDKQGQKQERTEWHRIVVWGRLAELCNQYLSKGREVYLEGRLQTRQWQDQQGQTKYTTEVVAQTMQFLGGASRDTQNDMSRGAGAGAGAGSYQGQSQGGGYGAGHDQGAQSFAGADEPSFTEDDVPF